jgi:hypothetical protein
VALLEKRRFSSSNPDRSQSRAEHRYNLHETREETDFFKQEQAYRKIKVLKSSVVDSE